MALTLGANAIGKLYLGSTQINKAYLGTTVLFSGGFSPADLFTGSETGVVYDVSDLSSMNTEPDQSGSVPAVGDVVRFIADKSGNGNDAQSLPSLHPLCCDKMRTAGIISNLTVSMMNLSRSPTSM